MESPKITVITVSYNSAQTIEKTIKSVIEQDYKNKEYIVIDGKSTDGTTDIIKRYEKHIGTFISEKDKGISDAFNKGIALSTGDLIVCINSDDYLLPGVLSKVAQMYDGKYDLYCGNLLLWNPINNYTCVIHPSLDFPKMPFFRRPAHQGVFIRKEAYELLGGYDIRIKYAMDLDFLMRATREKLRFKHIDINIAVFRLGGATADSIFKKRKEYIYIIRKNGGNILQAYIFYTFLVLTQTSKKIFKSLGFDLVRRIRYKKYLLMISFFSGTAMITVLNDVLSAFKTWLFAF